MPDNSDLSRLQRSRSNLFAAYETATENPKPDYSVDGESYSWTAYITMLSAEIEKIDALLMKEDPELNFEIEIRGLT